ncbi:MAG: OmpA family protein [Aureispira sp.]
MKTITSLYPLAAVCVASVLLWSCTRAGGAETGTEYMPDMAHSIAYEANHDLYYYNNTWGEETDYEAYAQPRKPVNGTVARGYLPNKYQRLADFKATPDEKHAVTQERVRGLMMADASLANPVKPADKTELERTLVDGKNLYTINCEVCHGEELKGDGVIYGGGDGPYSAKPANLVSEEFIGSTDGRFLNAILHGKGQMQPHADKMSSTERWKVIHYIRSMQAAAAGTEYNPLEKMDSKELDLKASFSNLLEQQKAGANIQDLKIELNNVLYSTGKAELKSSSSQTLDELASILTEFPEIHIEISGHTDSKGDAETNMQLSENRAHSVYDYLVGHGIAAERLAYKGYGATMPVATNDTDEGMAMNRRTEIKIIQ